jgi:hypothetical protein
MSEIAITASATQTSPNAVIKTGIAGAAGMVRTAPLIYQGIDDRWYPADADGAAPAYKATAWLLNDADEDQPIHFCTYDPMFLPGFTIAEHAIVMLSWTTAGRIRLIADVGSLPSGGVSFLTLCLFGLNSNFAQLQFVNVNIAKP